MIRQPSHCAHPETEFASFLSGGESRAFRFPYTQYYLEGGAILELFVACARDGEGLPRFLVSDDPEAGEAWLQQRGLRPGSLEELARHLRVPLLSPGEAWSLSPVHVPKPWGREIWYTGIEARGQSLVSDGHFAVPLPWVLALGSETILAPGAGEPNLLKILDPLPEEVYGDLYFELHERKREVYVVTHVAESAWPSGRGAIRYGFDPQIRGRFDSDRAFRRAYLAAVRDYEQVRRQIDALFDGFRVEEGISASAPVEVQRLRTWEQRLPRELVARERQLREAMNAFTYMMPLAVGDVVKVATHTPHALQHGVRTVEFQTPVYERRILSFAQKVLTQDRWDTAEAVEMMSLDPGTTEQLPVVADSDACRIEQVVVFDDFRVYRVTLAAGGECPLPDVDSYRLVMGVSGQVMVGQRVVASEQAVLVPRTAGVGALKARGPAVCLVSVPADAE